MGATDPLLALEKALAEPGTAALEQATRSLGTAYANDPILFYARAEIARRRRDFMQAAAFSANAIARIFTPGSVMAGSSISMSKLIGTCISLPLANLQPRLMYLTQFGEVFEQAGLFRSLEDSIDSLAAPLLDPARNAVLGGFHLMAILGLLGFTEHASKPWAELLLDKILLPSMRESARQGHFDNALVAEYLMLMHYVRREESQEWFKAATSRWVPLLAAEVRAKAKELGPRHDAWRPESVRRIGLLVHQASLLAHVVVVIETLAAVARVGARNYEFTVFVVGGRYAPMEERLRACNARVVYLDEGLPDGALFQRLLALEGILARENFAAILWISYISMMAVAFPRRIAPLQGWWAMKYHGCDIPEIDVHLAVENVVRRKRMEGLEWRTLGSASREWHDPQRAAAAAAIRARYAPDAIVTASIGREEKLDSPRFLDAVCELLRRNPKMVFLWTGRTARASIQSRFEAAGVADRAFFVGWVDTKAYAQAIDIFLDSFPFPCGFTLKEAMAAGKPAVMMRTAESLETGVPGAITPVVESPGEAEPEVRDRLKAMFTEQSDFDLYFCALNEGEYVDMACRLVADTGLRARVGSANRAFISEFLSSPEDEACKFLDHLDELFETIPKAS
jgi:glycosyltransferase involved in cell wall biosynthesis